MTDQARIPRAHPLWFPAAEFTQRATGRLFTLLAQHHARGMVLGASGGIDSLVTARLCIDATQGSTGRKVVGLQMTDRRIRGESYNESIYRNMGVDLVSLNITPAVKELEHQQGMPPRWLAATLMKLILKCFPTPLKRAIILRVMTGSVPDPVGSFYECLLVAHRIRAGELMAYARGHNLLGVTCTNRSEIRLGFFVQSGIDDPRIGDAAPISDLYKTQVLHLAGDMAFSRAILQQPPSPGFGGIGDEDILGPYPLIDAALQGLEQKKSDEEIISAMSARRTTGPGITHTRSVDMGHIQFLRHLFRWAGRKRPELYSR